VPSSEGVTMGRAGADICFVSIFSQTEWLCTQGVSKSKLSAIFGECIKL